MIRGAMETPASFEVRPAPSPYPIGTTDLCHRRCFLGEGREPVAP